MLGSKQVSSNYSYEHVNYTWETIRNFIGGTAFERDVIEIKADEKIAVFQELNTAEIKEVTYEMIHVVPHIRPLKCIAKSALADEIA